VVAVVTVRSPVVAVQLIVKLAGVVLFAVIETVCGFAPLTLQLDGTGLRPTEWFPTLRPLKVTLLFAPTGRLEAASTVTVYPDGGFGPDVAVVTVRSPVVGGGGVQTTVNEAADGWPAVIIAVCVFPPVTVQVVGTPLSVTV
jgi:hypothetical protein